MYLYMYLSISVCVSVCVSQWLSDGPSYLYQRNLVYACISEEQDHQVVNALVSGVPRRELGEGLEPSHWRMI